MCVHIYLSTYLPIYPYLYLCFLVYKRNPTEVFMSTQNINSVFTGQFFFPLKVLCCFISWFVTLLHYD